MKKGFIGLVAGVIASLGCVAQAADSNAYIGINYMLLEQESRFGGADDIETGETLVRFGGEISDHFSSELRLGTTTTSAEDGVAKFKQVYSMGGLLRLRKEFGALTPYVGLGYMWSREKLSRAGALTGEREVSDVAAAVGLDISLGEKLGLNVEYFAQSMEAFGADINRNGPSAGLFWRF